RQVHPAGSSSMPCRPPCGSTGPSRSRRPARSDFREFIALDGRRDPGQSRTRQPWTASGRCRHPLQHLDEPRRDRLVRPRVLAGDELAVLDHIRREVDRGRVHFATRDPKYVHHVEVQLGMEDALFNDLLLGNREDRHLIPGVLPPRASSEALAVSPAIKAARNSRALGMAAIVAIGPWHRNAVGFLWAWKCRRI